MSRRQLKKLNVQQRNRLKFVRVFNQDFPLSDSDIEVGKITVFGNDFELELPKAEVKKTLTKSKKKKVVKAKKKEESIETVQ